MLHQRIRAVTVPHTLSQDLLPPLHALRPFSLRNIRRRANGTVNGIAGLLSHFLVQGELLLILLVTQVATV